MSFGHTAFGSHIDFWCGYAFAFQLLFSKNNKKVDVFNKHNLFIGHSWHMYIIFRINLSTIESSISIILKTLPASRQAIVVYWKNFNPLVSLKKVKIQQENYYKSFVDPLECRDIIIQRKIRTN